MTIESVTVNRGGRRLEQYPAQIDPCSEALRPVDVENPENRKAACGMG
jgi:hypothetical protein